ncbi:MAG: VIT domain-containing protein [Verrucomicrobiota bacterium]
MKNWTTQAEQRLAEYLQERAVREGFVGEDAADLKVDLRRHIHEEAEQSSGEAIGLLHLEKILGHLDAGFKPQPVPRPELEFPVRKRGGFLNWTFGVILPLAVLILEVFTSFCGSVFLNPTPTWWHAAWIAAVPAVNFWLLRGGKVGNEGSRGLAAGFALFTAGFYGLLFLPMIHWSIFGLIFFGLGVLPLTPILAALSSWRIGRATQRDSADAGRFKSGWRLGALAAVMTLLTLEGPALWTRMNLSAAMAGGEKSAAAIARLRAFHSERTLLTACYEGGRGMWIATDISGWVVRFCRTPWAVLDDGGNWFQPMSTETVRDVFFRVTGKPFNSMKPPGNRGNSLVGRGEVFQEFDFDENHGGDEVAMRLTNLDLAQSRFDGHMDAVSRIGYGEWTMVFKNDSSQAKEARCKVKLPRDGRVSRLTLWVNGEPREAAFSTVSKVKAAYKAVAVVQRRDPVLVNMVGPDTVMVQCFPVPAHGEMKIRFGVTAPFDDRRWELPFVVERNFGIADNLENAVWMQGDCAFELIGGTKPVAANRDGPGYSLPATLGSRSLMGSGNALVTEPLPTATAVAWCEDRFAIPEERFLIREPTTVNRPAAGKLVVVIDGSLSLAGAKDWITKSLGSQGEGELVLVLADDQARRVTPEELKSYSFSGGRDNESALREGFRLSRENDCPVVWIHGPQAVRLSRSEALLQLLERGTNHPVIYEVEAVPGPNRLGEALYRTGCLRRGPTLIEPEHDFTRFLNDLRTERQEITWHWKRAATPDGLTSNKVWDQLARLWAGTTAENPAAVLTDAARAELAARYQLVTPWSGAVVLETQQQYDEHGLKPADGDATPKVPTVPEPSTSLLVILTTAAALMRRKRTE